MAFACPEPPSAMSAERSAGVRDGMQAFAFGTTETQPNRPGKEEAAFKTLSTSPAQLQRAKFKALAKKMGTRRAAAHLSSIRNANSSGPGTRFSVHIIREERRHIGRPSRKTTACFARHVAMRSAGVIALSPIGGHCEPQFRGPLSFRHIPQAPIARWTEENSPGRS